MKVLHIVNKYGLNNTGGAAIAATRIHNALVAAGVDSHYVCVDQAEAGRNVHVLPQGGWSRLWYRFRVKVTRCIWKFTPYRASISVNLVPLAGLEDLIAELRPDVMHVHWLNTDVMSFAQLSRLSVPVLFHLHDIWMLNALRPYPGTDTRFTDGYDRANSTRLERWMFERKRKVVKELSPSFVGPSEWICATCQRSVVGRAYPVHCIPYVYDARFRYHPELRARTDRFTILFGCYQGIHNPWKGWDDLSAAVKLLPSAVRRRCAIEVFGEMQENFTLEDIPVRFHGIIRDPEELVRLYHASDVFALASKEDNAPSTKFEALHCGLPVLAFERTGCAEGIVLCENGWIAPDGDIAFYAQGLEFFFNQWMSNSIDHASIAARVQSAFQTEETVSLYLNLYEKMVGDFSR